MYSLRGTKEGLTELLKIYLKNANLGEGDNVQIFDNFTYFPHYFQVQLTLNGRDNVKYWQQLKIAQAIIDQEKPAQTFYCLKILAPTMQLTKGTSWQELPKNEILEICKEGDVGNKIDRQTIPTILGTTDTISNNEE